MPRRTTPVGPYTAALARRVREERLERGWTQQQLAERAGLHLTHISGIERQRMMVSYETASRVARALGLTIGKLVPDQLFESIQG